MNKVIVYGIICIVLGVILIVSTPFLRREIFDYHPDINFVRQSNPITGVLAILIGIIMLVSEIL